MPAIQELTASPGVVLAMNPQLSPNLVSDLHQLLVYPFMVHALQAGSIVALMAAVVGWFMVLRRESFVGHTLSIMSFPGASAAALAGLPLAAGYFAFCGASALVIAGGSRTRARRDPAQESAVIGTVQALALALGFLFLSLDHGVLEGLETLLFGSILGVTSGQVLTLLLLAVGVLAFFALAGRPLLFASIDEDVARARGIPVRRLSVAFLLVLGLAVAATAQITGPLLVFALLVAPAATARELTPRVGLGLVLSVAIALLIVWLGLGLSYFTEDSSGFFVSSIALALYAGARGLRLLGARRGRRHDHAPVKAAHAH
jgi:zinc/manganese transport system permease protein